MSFCANCGSKQETQSKFCSNCGQSTDLVNNQSASPVEPTPTQTRFAAAEPMKAEAPAIAVSPGTVKKELLQLSNTYFSLFLLSFLAMKAQSEGGFKSIMADTGGGGSALIMIFIMLAAVVGICYFTVRIQGINKGKPAWVLVTLIVSACLTVLSWTTDNFGNYNWADWLSEAIGLAQLYILFAIYQLLKSAKSVQG